MLKDLYEGIPFPDLRTDCNYNFQYLYAMADTIRRAYSGDEPPAEVWNGRLWVDTSGEVIDVKVWTGALWMSILEGSGDMHTSIYDIDKDGRVNGLPIYDASHQELVFPF